MANIAKWRQPSMLTLRRDIDDILADFDLPRGFARDIDRMFDEDLSPRSFQREMERLFDDFSSPPSLRRRIVRLFDDLTGRLPGRRGSMFSPAVELTERDNLYVLRVDLPGMREQDIDVSVEQGNILVISGERQEEEKKKKEGGYEYTERSYGSFRREIELPRGADASKVDADYRNGVLEVHVQKSELAKARKVAIGRGREEPRVLESGNGTQREKSHGSA